MTQSDEITTRPTGPMGSRLLSYLRKSGPGYLQSAMTLGGGSVASCAVLGSTFGYKYLWVQVVAMAFGYAVLASVAKQSCHSGERAYDVFRRELHPSLAIIWAASALIATVLWHIPQYSLTANGLITLAEGLSVNLDNTAARSFVGLTVLGVSIAMVHVYHSGAKGIRSYETVVKLLIWTIVVAFGIAAFTGEPIEWGLVVKGVTGITFAQDLVANGIEDAAVKPVIGALAAAVGINMIFLYPYSVLQRGWGQGDKELAYFDLLTGMAFPFILATTLMILAVAKTIGPEPGAIGTEVRDVREIIPVLSEAMGSGAARLIIGVGMVTIGFSTIITHMLASGFIGCEMFGLSQSGRAKFWFSLLPAVGVVGVIMKFPIPLAITASTLAMPLMPVTVVCFIVLLNRPSYMGNEMPRGAARIAWNISLSVAAAVMTGAAVIALQRNWQDLQALF